VDNSIVVGIAAPLVAPLRFAIQIERSPSFVVSTPEIIDRETGVRSSSKSSRAFIAEAGDVIESPSPEFVAQARVDVRRLWMKHRQAE
jgi:hypothetical protein